MMAIPKSLLIHRVTLHHLSNEDRRGNGALLSSKRFAINGILFRHFWQWL